MGYQENNISNTKMSSEEQYFGAIFVLNEQRVVTDLGFYCPVYTTTVNIDIVSSETETKIFN